MIEESPLRWEILEKITLATGQLRGTIALLEKDIQALTKSIDRLTSDENKTHDNIQKDIREIDDHITKVSILLNASPFKEIYDRQKSMESHFKQAIQSMSSKLIILEKKIDKICKNTDNNKNHVENIKGMWAWRGILTTGILGIIGLLIKLILEG